MYASRLKYGRSRWGLFLRQACSLSGLNPSRFLVPQSYRNAASWIEHHSSRNFISQPYPFSSSSSKFFNQANHSIFNCNCDVYWPHSSRFYSSEGDERNASEDKHAPIKDDGKFSGEKTLRDKNNASARRCDQHARLAVQDQEEWLLNEKLFYESKKRESPFLTKRERFRNEFLRRVIPWEKITVCWENFPYYINENTKKMLVECAASHLKHKKFTSYGDRLVSSSARILLHGIPGTELYRERLVRALARELQVPLLVLDSNILAPQDFSEENLSETEVDDDNEESEEESASDSENDNAEGNEEEWTSGNDVKSDGSDVEDDVDVHASAEALKKLILPHALEEFQKRVSGESDTTPEQTKSSGESSQQPKHAIKKGDRVKYIGASVQVEVEHMIILGKIPACDGPTNAFTYINGRPLTTGQRGEVYEVNGDQVAVIMDINDNKALGQDDDVISKQAAKPSVYWIDIKDVEYDHDIESEDWFIAMEALCQVLPSLQPIIIYFPDSSQWLSKAVPKSKRKELVQRVEEMFDQLSGPSIFICGQNKVEAEPKDKEKLTLVLPQFGHLGKLPLPLRRLTEGLKGMKTSKDAELYKIFTNIFRIPPPKEDEQLRTFHKQIEEDRQIIILRSNINVLQKVMDEHDLACMELLHVKTDDVILTKPEAEKVVGWARNHYLSTCVVPCLRANRLIVPRESLEIAISRLRDQETMSRKMSQSLKSLAEDDFESNFVSAVVPPDEIGVKFDDIGALEDVKRTLNELVTLPMRRPGLFSHGNLLRPCKGILLFGPPGTGKTLLAKALATEAGANFISITGSTLTSKWFGDAEKLTRALFSFASKLSPVIIFVDEVDSLLGARGSASEHEATRRMRNEFMAAWDGLRSKDNQRILILGATNRPFDLDDAVIRRLPRRIYVDLPDAENRMKILQIFLKNENLDPNFKAQDLANATEGYSGSDLKNLCVAAAYRPIQELLEEEKKGGTISTSPIIRPLNLNDFIEAKAKVGASVAYDATSMNELRRWNEQYGEGGSRKKSPFGFGN